MNFPTQIPFFNVTLSQEKLPSLYSKRLLDHGNDMRHVIWLKNNSGVDYAALCMITMAMGICPKMFT